ncbi:unnamed protein product [Bemisia tabaci]|uniref:Uncharacterized protein n=1 Tax=Bemisia tabaci TaxID=7038 RepID=A0A9P0EX40_BEMTA|nr:unnamed protein product [Bemisia tabaci]
MERTSERQRGRCPNCLSTHSLSFCNSPKRCAAPKCGRRHNTLLHEGPGGIPARCSTYGDIQCPPSTGSGRQPALMDASSTAASSAASSSTAAPTSTAPSTSTAASTSIALPSATIGYQPQPLQGEETPHLTEGRLRARQTVGRARGLPRYSSSFEKTSPAPNRFPNLDDLLHWDIDTERL